MIQRSISLKRRLEHEIVRHAGTLARLIYYKGEMPLRCELLAEGERVDSLPADEAKVRDLAQGNDPVCPEGTYWRLMDNNGNVVMQGKANE